MILRQGTGGVLANLLIRNRAEPNTTALGAICLVVLCVVLSLGLWPFRAPRNQVAWLKDANGLSFGRFGTVISSDTLDLIGLNDETCCSLEIWAQPHPWQDSATLVEFYRPENPYALRLSQSLVDFRFQGAIPNGAGPATQVDLFIPEIFRYAKPAFITITSGRQGIAVYVSRALAGTAPRLRIPKNAFAGRILLGDAPLQPDSWYGQIRGLAIYDAELTAGQVFRHYNTWTKNGRPAVAEDEHPIALYLFDEHSGSIIHSKIQKGADLHIPERYLVVDKLFMEPFWHEFAIGQLCLRILWDSFLSAFVFISTCWHIKTGGRSFLRSLPAPL